MTPSRDDAALEVTSIRLPQSLKRIISVAAKEHGLSFSEELRNALHIHYKTHDDAATLKDIHDAIVQLVETMRLQGSKLPMKIASDRETASLAPSRSDKQNAKEPKRERDEIFAERSQASAKLLLETLREHLKNGEEITSKMLELETGISCRIAGRQLKLNGVHSKNTRIKGVSGRYFLIAVLPAVEKALAELD